MTLDMIELGQTVEILELQSHVGMTRFGLVPGTLVTIVARVPGGPVVVQLHRQEIAIGRSIAKRILVVER